jgi:hypothetical protein
MRARPKPPMLSEKDNAFLSYGKAMANWASLERAVYEWFQHITLLDAKQAKPIFYSVTNTKTRFALVRAALSANQLDRDERIFVEKALNRAGEYSSFRNKLAHGEFTFEGIIIEGKHHDRAKATETGITREQVDRAASRFRELADLLYDAYDIALRGHDNADARISDCLERLNELPKQADFVAATR